MQEPNSVSGSLIESHRIGKITAGYVQRTTTVYGAEFPSETLFHFAWMMYIAKKAQAGDQDAIDLCLAAKLVVVDVNGVNWFNYQDIAPNPLTDVEAGLDR